MSRLFIFLISLALFDTTMAQNSLNDNPVVSGTVLSESGELLNGVSVKVSLPQGKHVASATTDQNGVFTIAGLKVGNVYDFSYSYVGYELTYVKGFKIDDGNVSSILVRLKQQSNSLSEVVVTALNIKRDKRNTGYLVESLDGHNISENKTVNIQSSLSGKIAGLDVGTTANGAAGSKRVTIRGIASISGNNQPLWVVDGIPINTSVIGNATPSGGGGIDFGDGLTYLNPDDIESVSVLKGNAAAALYGSRASTGAILVTTKSGSKLGKNKFEVSYNGSYTVDQAKDLTDWQYEYGQGTGGKAPVTLQDVLASTSNWGAKLDGSDVLQFDNKLRPYVAQKDNVKNFYKDGSTLSNTVALSGRTENTNFRVSASNVANNDIIPNSSFDKNTFSFHSETKYNKLTVNAVVNYSIEKVNNRQRVGGNSSNLNYTILNLPTNVNVLDMKPGYNPATGAEIGITDQGIPTNPYFVTNRIVEKDERRRINGSLEVKYDFAKWLFAKGRVLEDYYDYQEKDYTPSGVIWSPKGGGMNQDGRRNAEENYEMIVGTNKHKLISDLKISGFAGGNIYNSLLNTSNVNGTVFILDNVYTINNLSVKYPSTGFYKQKTNSLFYSAELEFRDLFINVTGRKDWFSTLPLNNNSLFYPSVSFSYILNNRYYPSWLSFAKLRGSFAQVSGGASPYQLDLSYSLDRDSYNGISLQHISNGVVPNAGLKPLLSTEYETGVDLGLLNNKLTLNLTYYNRRTKQDIVSTNISITSGYNAAIVNLGQISNKGLEASLKANVIESKNFSWDVLGLFSYNRNNVENLGPGISKLQLAISKTGNAFVNIESGMPYGQIEGYMYSRDAKGQIIYDANGFPLSNGVVKVLGNANYDKIASISNSISYKNFYLYFLVDSKFGAKIYSEVNSLAVAIGKSKSTLPGRETGITGNGTTATGDPNNVLVTPANLLSYYGRVATFTENYVYDASFIKLREISIGYRIPKTVVSKLRMSNASLSFIARNLFTLYKKTPNFDPESNTTSDNAQGIASAVYPVTRNLGVSLNVTF